MHLFSLKHNNDWRYPCSSAHIFLTQSEHISPTLDYQIPDPNENLVNAILPWQWKPYTIRKWLLCIPYPCITCHRADNLRRTSAGMALAFYIFPTTFYTFMYKSKHIRPIWPPFAVINISKVVRFIWICWKSAIRISNTNKMETQDESH